MKFDDLQSSFEPAPEGSHTAILVSLIDKGEQPGKFGAQRHALLRWVLPNVETETGETCIVFQRIWNLSLRSKAFREVVSGLMGDEPLAGRSLRELVGRPARLTIVHNETETQTYANVAAVKPLKPGAKAPKTEQDLIYFSLSPDEFSEAALKALSERDQELIKASPTYAATLRVLEDRKKATKDLINDDFPEELGGDPEKPVVENSKPRRPKAKAAFASLTEA
jgi:hypothetical protein